MSKRKFLGSFQASQIKINTPFLLIIILASTRNCKPFLKEALDFEPIIFNESIFRKYHPQILPRKQIKSSFESSEQIKKDKETISKFLDFGLVKKNEPQNSSNIPDAENASEIKKEEPELDPLEKRLSIFKESRRRRKGLILGKPKQVHQETGKTSSNSFEKFLQMYVGKGMTVDSRKLSEIRCNNTFVKSYIDMDEEDLTLMEFPNVADWKMVEICENNKTTCCNLKETQLIREIFEKTRNKARTLIKIYKKIVVKLCKDFHKY